MFGRGDRLHFVAACFPGERKVVSEGRPVMSWGICVFVDMTVSTGARESTGGKGRKEGRERGSIEWREHTGWGERKWRGELRREGQRILEGPAERVWGLPGECMCCPYADGTHVPCMMQVVGLGGSDWAFIF